jgi:hypothetical protein
MMRDQHTDTALRLIIMRIHDLNIRSPLVSSPLEIRRSEDPRNEEQSISTLKTTTSRTDDSLLLQAETAVTGVQAASCTARAVSRT